MYYVLGGYWLGWSGHKVVCAAAAPSCWVNRKGFQEQQTSAKIESVCCGVCVYYHYLGHCMGGGALVGMGYSSCNSHTSIIEAIPSSYMR